MLKNGTHYQDPGANHFAQVLLIGVASEVRARPVQRILGRAPISLLGLPDRADFGEDVPAEPQELVDGGRVRVRYVCNAIGNA